MKKLLFILLILVVGACKDKDSVGPNRADGFVGVYYTNPSKDNRTSFYVWVVTRKSNDRLGIGYYIEDTYRLGSQGTISKKKEVYFLDDVIINTDSSFTINESVDAAGIPVKLSGNGRLVRRSDGSGWIDVSLDYVGPDNKAVRSADQVSFQKVGNKLDENMSENDFDYVGNYVTELPDGAKTAFHNWAVAANGHASVSVDYKIRDQYNQGSIGELVNNYVLSDAKRLGNRSLSIDMAVKEEISGDQIKVRAVGNKLLKSEGSVPIIAVIVQIINETQGIARMDYLELKKQ